MTATRAGTRRDTARARATASTDATTLAAEVALVALSLATVAGFGRLFADGDFFLPLAVVAVVSHVVAALARRRGAGVVLSALVLVVALVPVLTLLFFAGESTLGLPGPAVLDAAQAALDEAWVLFSDVVAPAPTATGFLIASALGVAVAAYLADWAAFRLWSPIEAVVPPGTLFVFASMLGADRHRVLAAALFAGAALVFLLLHRAARLATTGSWVDRATDRGTSAVVRAGAGLAAVAVVLGVVAGPELPGADQGSLVSWRGDEDGPSSRVTISPLVDIRTRLVRQADVEVFTVRAPRAAYWRLTALDTFDGEIWRSGGSYAAADGELPEGVDSQAERDVLRQEVLIENLAALWLPAAYEPTSVRSPEIDVRYQAESGTLIVDTDVDTSDGMGYVVESALPTFTPEQLAGASQGSIDPARRERYTALADPLPADAAELAEQVTAAATSDYARAMALQTWFRDPAQFTYDLEAPAGHGVPAISSFLEQRRGYCEQFAGTFAAMARHLGIPARVAVGFTWGTWDERSSQYRVRGEHAHAWPEVYFEGFGWVPFEPTPGRGAPGAEAWTGVAPGQAGEVEAPIASSTSVPATATTLVPVPSSVAPTTAPSDEVTAAAGPGADESDDTPDSDSPALRVAIAVGAVALAYALAVPGAIAVRRGRRRRRAAGPGERAVVAWDEALEALGALGVRRRPDHTYHEFASATADRFPGLGSPLRDLAEVATRADYAPGSVADGHVATAEHAAARVEASVTERLGRRRALARSLDVRRVVAVGQSSRRNRSRMR